MMADQETLALIDRWQKRSWMVAVAALGLCLIGAVFNLQQLFRSYLLGYLFWIGVALGSMAITLLHHLSGGRWGAVIRRFLEAATRTLPLMAALFLPILLGLGYLYEWTHTEHMLSDPVLQHKVPYLNTPFFIARNVIYFAVWLFLVYMLNKYSRQEDTEPGPALQGKFQFFGGMGLLIYGLTMSFASVDWMMSLEPHWFSTIYGLIVIEGQVLSAFAFVIVIAASFVKYKPISQIMAPLQFHDLGKLTFAFVMVWAYLAFSQFLIIWSGNLPEEIPWYLHRTHQGWNIIAIALIVFHFALPFLLLLSQKTKKDPRILGRIALGILVMRFVDLFYLVGPEFHQEGLSAHFMDFLMPVGIGGVWFAHFLKQLKAQPLVAVNDPNLQEILADARA